MKITILCVSDSHKHFSEAIQEYEKRLGKSCEVVQIKPVKYGSREQIIQKETEAVLAKLEKFSEKKFMLTLQGKSRTTDQRQKHIKLGQSYVFIIGGPYGLDENMLSSHLDGEVSFGKQTMPHGLALTVLLEQLYRVSTLHQGKTYHY